MNILNSNQSLLIIVFVRTSQTKYEYNLSEYGSNVIKFSEE